VARDGRARRLIGAKMANVGVPLVLKKLIDQLAIDPAHPQALLVLPLGALVAYGLLRLSTTVFTELREFLFARVTQRAVRTIALQVFRHLHALSLRFHLNRQTGGMTRDIERGTRGVSSLISYSLFNVLPTLVEITLVLGYLVVKYDKWFSIITAVALATYITFTVVVTEWRTHFRRTMNDLDSKANTKAIDSLINYETVKYFGNEDYEAKRYDQGLQNYENAAVRSQTSLSVLNTGQSLIIATAVTLILWRATEGVIAGTMTLGDLVLVNSFMIQLYIPLNFLGVIYREIKQSLADMERLFGCSTRTASGRHAGRAAADRAGRSCAIFARRVQLRNQAPDPVRRRLRDPGRDHDRGGRPQRLGQVDAVTPAVPLLRREQGRDQHRRPGHPQRHPAIAAPWRSASCRRIRCCSTTPSNTTSPMAGRAPPTRTSSRRRGRRRSTTSSRACRTAMRRWWASAD
jgi:ABC-type multidrug transport system fused ATPase/permease subunit